VPTSLTGVRSGVRDGEAVVSGNAGGCSKGYGVAAVFERVRSEVRDGKAAVSGKAGSSSRFG